MKKQVVEKSFLDRFIESIGCVSVVWFTGYIIISIGANINSFIIYYLLIAFIFPTIIFSGLFSFLVYYFKYSGKDEKLNKAMKVAGVLTIILLVAYIILTQQTLVLLPI